MEVMKSLGIEPMLPPTFNPETGQFDEPVLRDEEGKLLNVEEMDVFELAARRGVSVKELLNDKQSLDSTQSNFEAPRHQKKDYERLKQLGMLDIMKLTHEVKQQKKFEDDSLKGIVKVEKKKEAEKKKVTRKEQMARDQEIQKMLDTPQDINYEKAMQLYEEQSLEAKEISIKEQKRLQRLKRKAAKAEAVA